MLNCTIENCGNVYYCKDLCKMHYDLRRRRGTTIRLRPNYNKVTTNIKDTVKDIGKGRRGFLAVNLVNDIKFKAKQRGKIWNLSGEQAFALIKTPCYYCGFKPQWPESRVGIDRVDNTKGYEFSNCVSCCFTCNSAKKELTQEDFYKWIERIYFNTKQYKKTS